MAASTLREYQRIDVLIGVVELGVKVRQNIGEPVVDRRNSFPHGAAQLTGCVGGGLGALGLDEVDDGLAWVRSIRPFKKARLVNSPGPACLAPLAKSACRAAESTAGEPWQ